MKTLKEGSQGQDVIDWQEFLCSLNLLDDHPDGKFGENTKESTKEFQEANPECGQPDGIVGTETWEVGLKKGLERFITSTSKETLRKENLQRMISALLASNLKGRALHIGVLCCIAKESNFIPRREIGYGHTSIKRIRRIFRTTLENKTDEEILAVRNIDIKFFDLVYGGRGGNNEPGDGYKYRGRGFNQITFKNTYSKYGSLLDLDLVCNPDLLNDPMNAARACILFKERALTQGRKYYQPRFGISSLDEVNSVDLAIGLTVNANAGWGKDKRGSSAEKAAKRFEAEMTRFYDDYVQRQNLLS